MSKADDVFIRQFIIVLVLLAAYGVAAAVLGIWIAGSARDASAGSERATLERIAPIGRLKLGEPGQRARAEAEAAASESASTAVAAATPPADDDATASGTAAPDSSGAAGTTVVAAVSPDVSASGASGPAAGAIDAMGEKIYKQYCFACHLTGVAEAPKTGDTEAWAPRAATGFDTLYQNVIKGKGAMPPKAGFPHLTDEEFRAGIRYLLVTANVTAE